MFKHSGVSNAVLLLAGLCSLVLARRPSFEEREAVQDSLSRIPPRWRELWLRDRGLEDPHVFGTLKPESTGLRLVGKFGRGPAVEVTGRDSLVFLSLGSEVAVVSFARPDTPRVLSEIQLGSIAVQAHLRDSLLFTGDYGAIEIWDVRDPTQPVRLGRIPYGVGDFCVQDTFVYFMRQDTFRVFGVADPATPRQLGFYRDSATALAASGNTVVCGHPRQGVVLVDVTNPASPRRAGSYPGWLISAGARGSTCYATFGNPNLPDELTLRVLDISNPASPVLIATVNDCGGYDVFLRDSLAFLSGYYAGDHGFKVLSIADSARPRVLGSCGVPGDKFGVWSDLERQRAYVASDLRGLGLVNISNLIAPTWDTSLFAVGLSVDISVQGDLAFVASNGSGMLVLDVSDPTAPGQLSAIDSTVMMETNSVLAADSFAYMGFSPSWFGLRSVDVSDPVHPATAGGVLPFNPIEDLALCDSFLLAAEDHKFEVYNVARPRQPVLVGSCNLPWNSGKMALRDSIAYVANGTSLRMVKVSDPTNPRDIGTWSRYTSGVDVADTIAYTVGADYAVWSVSVANPSSPRTLDSAYLGDDSRDVAIVGATAFTSEDRIHVVDVSEPGDIRVIGHVSVPYWTPRLVYVAPYVYACCSDAGICIFETTMTAIRDAPSVASGAPRVSVIPNPTAGLASVRLRGPLSLAGQWLMCDVLGRALMAGWVPAGQKAVPIDIRAEPDGVYVFELRHQAGVERTKIVKR